MPASSPSTRAASPPPWRVVIAGAGIAGLALALAVKRGLGAAIEVTVCDPLLDRERPDERAFALSAGARRMLEVLGVWPALAADAQPIHEMTITDSRLGDPVRPVFLTFAGEAGPGEPYATMMPARPLARALRDAAAEAGALFRASGIAAAEPGLSDIKIALQEGGELAAALLIACDGARSRLREEAGIGWVSWRYGQVGIAATIGHERAHQGRAVQHFLPSGPFALLPLAGRGTLPFRSSIVWTEEEGAAASLLALPPDALAAEIVRRFGLTLGRIALDSSPHAHPLRLGLARRYSAPRLALIGDAAHEIHPLAGQGLNLGLADAAALAEEIADAVRLGLDPGAPDKLAAYERRRRPDAAAMALATDGLNRLFSNESLPTRLIRDLGLGFVDRAPGLKGLFIDQAASVGAGGARLLQGKRL